MPRLARYAPDAKVVCREHPLGDPYQENPVVIVEVLNGSTRSIGLGEKRET